MFGGAMNLQGFSSIQYKNNTAFYFVGNKAKLGGAIYVRSVDQHLVFASYTCFLSHGPTLDELTQQNPTNITFSFIANRASYNLSHSLYLSSSVNACINACVLLLHVLTSLHTKCLVTRVVLETSHMVTQIQHIK